MPSKDVASTKATKVAKAGKIQGGNLSALQAAVGAQSPYAYVYVTMLFRYAYVTAWGAGLQFGTSAP